MATVYAVASAKGGVGKTTTTAAVATLLAGSGADVVAIDADIGMANLADALGIDPSGTTIHDVLAGDASPTDAVHAGPAGLRVIPGETDLDAYAAADPSRLSDVVEAFGDADIVAIVVNQGSGNADLDSYVDFVEVDGVTYDFAPADDDPDNKDVCKNDGWQDFDFRNQGQCIRFVNTEQDSR